MTEFSLPGKGDYSEDARRARLLYLNEYFQVSTPFLDALRLSSPSLKSNVESLIGAIEVPVGIAGPLRVRGEKDDGLVCASFATTEGALVASASRGAKLLNLAGGVSAQVLWQRMVRVPVFGFSTMRESGTVARWVLSVSDTLKAKVADHSRHAQLQEVIPHVKGRYLHLWFIYETGDAAGQNMSTVCTWHLCQWLAAEIHRQFSFVIHTFLVEGNLSSDKKPRGKIISVGGGSVWWLSAISLADLLWQVLRITPDTLMQNYRIMFNSGAATGQCGVNGNIANVVAAIFTATGQDIASVHEASVGEMHLEPDGEGLYASLMMPCLTIGTVGGGTGLPGQQECLALMGCQGAGKVRRLAEVICAFALALDISTISALATDEFTQAHNTLGRNRPATL